jgi:hypothetical protein
MVRLIKLSVSFVYAPFLHALDEVVQQERGRQCSVHRHQVLFVRYDCGLQLTCRRFKMGITLSNVSPVKRFKTTTSNGKTSKSNQQKK